MNGDTEFDSTDEESLDELEPSKSQRKRDALEVRVIAERLTQMQARKLDQLPLSEQVRYAVDQCPPPAARGARKRQLQFISKLLRKSDSIDQIQQRLENPDQPTSNLQHETMCSNLLASFADHADELRQNYPGINLQQVRQLVRNAANEASKKSKTLAEDAVVDIRSMKSAKALLKLLSASGG